MIRFLVERPVAVLVSFLALLLLGIVAAIRIPMSLLPNTDIPEISVNLNAPDYAAGEVEQLLVTPLRNRLQQLRGLTNIESKSSEGRGNILLSFEHGANTSLAFIEVNEKVDMSMGDLPRDVARPLVNKASISTIPAFSLNVYAKDTSNIRTNNFAELSHFVREVIRRRIEQLPTVAMVDITGTQTPQIQITPRTNYLQALGISPTQLAQALAEHKIVLGNILVQDGHYRYYLRFRGGLHELSQIAATPIRIDSRVFRINDLAER
jgi:multidrug efflux pump subunit AcrB